MEQPSLFEITAEGVDNMLANAQSDILKLLEELKSKSTGLDPALSGDLKELQNLIVHKIDLIQEKIERRISELM